MLLEKLDPEMDEMVKAEIKDLNEQKEALEQELTILLLPKDPNDSKNVIMEIRAGTGGDEAAVCRRFVPHVYPLCRNAGLENRSDEHQLHRRGRL